MQRVAFILGAPKTERPRNRRPSCRRGRSWHLPHHSHELFTLCSCKLLSRSLLIQQSSTTKYLDCHLKSTSKVLITQIL